MGAWTIASLLETAADFLKEKGSASPRLDAELLLAEALGLERIYLYTHHDRPLTSCEVDHYRTLIARRARHEPVAYILGCSHFRRLTLAVTPEVLIPRPETEELVDLALESLRLRPLWEAYEEPLSEAASGTVAGPLIADVGTGSGALALSMAQESGLRVLATDTSPGALAVAQRNRAAAGLDDLVEFRVADLLADVPDTALRLVVSNPPYITSAEMESLSPDVRLFEPPLALHGGSDGLDAFRRLLPQAARALLPGGTLMVEVGHRQAELVSEIARDAGFALVNTSKDLSGKERFVSCSLPGAPIRDPDSLDAVTLGLLAQALEAGAMIGLPTDTVYGLAARWDSGPGVRRLFAAKGRDFTQPVATLFSSVKAVVEALPDLEPSARLVLERLLPGPFTFIVSTTVARPRLVGTDDSLGVRVPDHPALLRLLAHLGTGVAATSANLSGEKEAVTLDDVAPALLAHCSLALSDPRLADAPHHSMKPSTVVDLRPLVNGERPQILREGAVSAADVLERMQAL